MQQANGHSYTHNDDKANPLGTDGFEFIEFAGDKAYLTGLLTALGFVQIGVHKHKAITLWQQGEIRFIINSEASGTSADFARTHGPCACAMAFRVKNGQAAYKQLIEQQARAFDITQSTLGLTLPAVYGVGDSALYLMDAEHADCYEQVFELDNAIGIPKGAGLTYLDHVTHNVYQGHMDEWADFYSRHFNFKEIHFFDIQGQMTGLKSRAMTSPCGKIRIPINESADDKSQIVEYLNEYKGEGIQHIALGSEDIYATVAQLRSNGVEFLSVPDTYYEMIDERVADHMEDIPALQHLKILIDGAPRQGKGLLLQIFTKNVIGPIFFEIIQRKGNDGFGEGNFQALFEAIERDQVARGVL